MRPASCAVAILTPDWSLLATEQRRTDLYPTDKPVGFDHSSSLYYNVYYEMIVDGHAYRKTR
jgi:hypothetical protein